MLETASTSLSAGLAVDPCSVWVSRASPAGKSEPSNYAQKIVLNDRLGRRLGMFMDTLEAGGDSGGRLSYKEGNAIRNRSLAGNDATSLEAILTKSGIACYTQSWT